MQKPTTKLLTDAQIRTYLNRINYSGDAKLNFATLHALQKNHLQTIPYENLDIMRNIPLSLRLDDMYNKIIIGSRGGYCFELNGLFSALLKSMGFAVVEYMARFLRDEKEIPMRRHRVLHITCADGEFLCDVGVGGVIPRKPLPLEVGKITSDGAGGNERYKLEKEDLLGWVLYEQRGEWLSAKPQNPDWRKLYSFTTEPQLDIDYEMPSFYCEKHPESFFRTMDMVHVFTDTGRKSVAGREVRIFSPGGVEVVTAATDGAYAELLKIHFNIKL